MKKLLFITLLLFCSNLFAAKVLVSSSEQDAEIFSNGQKVGTGSAIIVVPKNGKTVVTVN